MSAADSITEAEEQLTLVQGVLLEMRHALDRIAKGLQALENARAELQAARREVEGGA